MLHRRKNDKKFKHLIQNDKPSSYEELLEKDGSISVQHRNIQSLRKAIKVLQVKHIQSREIVCDIFTQVTQEQNLRKNLICRIPSLKTVPFFLKAFPIKPPKLGKSFWKKINEFISLNSFKKETRNWVPQDCLSRLLKQYISGAGFPLCLVVFFIFKVLVLLFYYYILTIFTFFDISTVHGRPRLVDIAKQLLVTQSNKNLKNKSILVKVINKDMYILILTCIKI